MRSESGTDSVWTRKFPPLPSYRPVIDGPEVRRIGDDGDVGAVDERLLRATADRLLAIRAGAPRVAGVVGPLKSTLRARDVGRQLHLPSEDAGLPSVLRDDVANRVGAGHAQRVPGERRVIG